MPVQRTSKRKVSTRITKKLQTKPATRLYQYFTEAEDDLLVETLVSVPRDARLVLAPYLELENAYPLGKNHSPKSWLGRYKRFRSVFDERIKSYRREQTHPSKSLIRGNAPAPAPKKQLRIAIAPSSKRAVNLFYDLCVSPERFNKTRRLAREEQRIAMSLAIRLLADVHDVGVDVVLAMWERVGSLEVADKELRRVVAQPEGPLTPDASDPPDSDDDATEATEKRKRDGGTARAEPPAKRLKISTAIAKEQRRTEVDIVPDSEEDQPGATASVQPDSSSSESESESELEPQNSRTVCFQDATNDGSDEEDPDAAAVEAQLSGQPEDVADAVEDDSRSESESEDSDSDAESDGEATAESAKVAASHSSGTSSSEDEEDADEEEDDNPPTQLANTRKSSVSSSSSSSSSDSSFDLEEEDDKPQTVLPSKLQRKAEPQTNETSSESETDEEGVGFAAKKAKAPRLSQASQKSTPTQKSLFGSSSYVATQKSLFG